MNKYWFVVLLLLTRPAVEHVMASDSELLQPKTYHSPSGVYSVFVDPSSRYGDGKAGYRLTKNGKEVWKKDFPFSLWHAAITNDGTFGGAAYSGGFVGLGQNNTFQIALIDPTGELRMQEIIPCAEPRNPYPRCESLFFDSGNDRMVLRVKTEWEEPESWWSYRLSDGASVSRVQPWKFVPDNEHEVKLVSMQPVSGTSLTLAHWRTQGKEDAKFDSRISLHDLEGTCIWHLDMPEAYVIDVERTGMHGQPLRNAPSQRFDIWAVAESKRVVFAVDHPVKAKWIVREVERKPYQPPAKPAELTFPELQLKHLRTIELRSAVEKPVNPIRNVSSFQIDDQGRIAFVRHDMVAGNCLVVVEPNGALLEEIPLNRPDMKACNKFSPPHIAWVGGNRFVLVTGAPDRPRKAIAWAADIGSKRIELLGDFDCPEVDYLAGGLDGGFVAIVDEGGERSAKAVCAFDKVGRRIWTVKGGYENGPVALCEPVAIAVTTRGEIAVASFDMNSLVHVIKFFDKSGSYARTLNPKEAWGRHARPNELSADLDGGLLVEELSDKSPIVRMAADGKIRQELKKKEFANGRRLTVHHHVRVAPDGRVWATDNHALLRFDENGVVDRVLGEAPDPKHLGRILFLNTDLRGRFFACDQRTSSTHVFDEAGQFQFVCQLEPTDFPTSGPDRITGAPSGEIVAGNHFGQERIRFAADGTRMGNAGQKFGNSEDSTEEWHFQPDGKRLWVATFTQLHLLNGDDLLRTITRWPDGTWISGTDDAVVASDGSIAVYSDAKFHIFNNNGEPIRSFRAPGSMSSIDPFTYDGNFIAWADDRTLFLMDTIGKPIGQFSPFGKDGERLFLKPYLRAKEGHLITFKRERSLSWFELPKK